MKPGTIKIDENFKKIVIDLVEKVKKSEDVVVGKPIPMESPFSTLDVYLGEAPSRGNILTIPANDTHEKVTVIMRSLAIKD